MTRDEAIAKIDERFLMQGDRALLIDALVALGLLKLGAPKAEHLAGRAAVEALQGAEIGDKALDAADASVVVLRLLARGFRITRASA